MRAVDAALQREADRLEADTERDLAPIRQSLRALDEAYDADLKQTGELTPRWVREATAGYVAAREALVRHELALLKERQTRADNLRAAAAAQQRAILLIEQQDRLVTDTLNVDLWRLIETPTENQP